MRFKQFRDSFRRAEDLIEEEIEEFYPKQIEVLESGESRVILNGGMGSGKTLLACRLFYEKMMASSQKMFAISGYSRPSIERNVLPKFEELGIPTTAIHPSSSILRIGGKKVAILGLDSIKARNKVRGIEVGGLLIDEATMCMEKPFGELMTRVRQKRGSAIPVFCIMTTNPDSPNHWFYKKYYRNEKTEDSKSGWKVYNFKTSDNIFLEDGYIEGLGYEKDSAEYKRFFLGEWVDIKSHIFAGIKIMHYNKVVGGEVPIDGKKRSTLRKVAFIDPSLTQGGDGTALAIGWEWKGIYYIKGYLWKKTGYDVCLEEIVMLSKEASLKYFEDNKGTGLRQILRKIYHESGWRGHHTSTNKENRILKYASVARRGKIVLVEDGTLENDYFINEVISYTPDKEVQRTDDAPDAMSLLLDKLMRIV